MKKFGVPRPFSVKTFFILFNTTIILLISLVALLLPSRMYTSLFTQQAEAYCQDIVVQTSYGVLSAVKDFDMRIEQLIGNNQFQEIMLDPELTTENLALFRLVVASQFPPRFADSVYLQELDLYIKGSGYNYTYGSKPTNLDDSFGSKYFDYAMVYPTKLNWINYNAQANCIEMVRLIYDKQSYETQAFLIIRLSTDFLQDEFDAFNRIAIDNMFITNESGNVFCSKEYDLLGSRIQQELLHQMSGETGIIRQGDNLTVYCRFRNVNAAFPYEDWYTIIELSRSAILKDFYSVLSRIYWTVIIFIIIEIIVAIKISGYFTEPVNDLVATMEQVRKGHFKSTYKARTPILEMKVLEQGFNEMVGKLDNLIATVYENSLIQKELQLKALQSQINPHFLFNTLQLISWKAHDYGADNVSEMIHSLSSMLDTDLYEGDENTFTLRDEIAYIQHYSKIIKYKYEDKIQLLFDVDGNVQNCRIPKLILQPFVENAVIHGLAPKPDSGKVVISAHKEDSDLIVMIIDDGIGIGSHTLEVLKSDKQERLSIADRDSHHIALKNIQNRLKILYGGSYGFEIDSHIYSGTAVTMRLPYVTKEGKDDQGAGD